MKKSLVGLLLISTLSACISIGSGDPETTYPKEPRDERRAKRGKLLGDGGIKLFGKSENAGQLNGIGVNNVLWRASLDSLSFLPIKSADPFGGVIITDWHTSKESPNERYKLNVLILDSALRADALKVSVFKQIREEGEWKDSGKSDKMAREIEDRILTNARKKRIDLMAK